ncbi:Peptide deformylase [Streptomyces californicus]
MSQQETDGRTGVDDEGFVVDTEDCEEREAAYRARGTSRPITVVGNPVLHKECKDVTAFDDELARLIDDMFASQKTAEGVGLAANQIGVDLKVFVYDCPDDDGVRHTGRRLQPGPGGAGPRDAGAGRLQRGLPLGPDRVRLARPPPTTRWCAARTPRAHPIRGQGHRLLRTRQVGLQLETVQVFLIASR